MNRAENQNEQVIKGTVKRVTFRNPSNGYSVLQLKVEDKREQITVVGNCLEAGVGANLIVRGIFIEHPKFGRQFTATSITETAPSSEEGIETYLASGIFKGIGEKTANRIVTKFGVEAVEVILKQPEKIARIPGIGKHKAKLLSQALYEKQESLDIMRFLLENKISVNLANKIYERYKNKAVEILSKDPYLLAREVRGVGFLTADGIAMNLGLKPDSPQRLKAGLYYALEQATEDGHCFLSHEALIQRASSLLGLDQTQDLDPLVEELIREEFVVRYQDGFFLSYIHRAEEYVAEFVAERLAPRDKGNIGPDLVKQALARSSKELKVTFSEDQEEAVRLAANYRLMIITGGPGCGKTTIIQALTVLYRESNKRLLLCAPTGRAAQRMSAVCKMPASTIHRMLRYDPMKQGFLHGQNEPLVADAVIVDEASMIDINLARDLFSAIGENTTLILVGDKDQLPSVGPGRVFAELVSVKDLKTISLSKLFRRGQESSINDIAFMINSGVMPTIPEPDGVTKVDAYFLPRKDSEEAALTIENLVADQIPKKFAIETSDISVLTPTNRGPLGTIALNKRLQNRLNPVDGKLSIKVGDNDFRVGDRVCQRVNNYNIDPAGVFNGDLGYIYSIDKQKLSLVVDMWDGRLITYSQSELYQLSLAYAVTVHRSQGSEIPCVVLALHDSHFALLERQLTYTAVTRAKRLLVVCGSKRALAIACKKTTTSQRGTMLKDRILRIIQ